VQIYTFEAIGGLKISQNELETSGAGLSCEFSRFQTVNMKKKCEVIKLWRKMEQIGAG
jgi:hypothetical protein